MPNYLPGAEPFHFAGNRVGCLLIHGFTGTPYEMRGLGERLARQGYTVACPALAGHATAFEDILPTRWTDWYATVTTAYDHLTETCDAIFPIGLSLGGLLALHLAAHRAVNGVVALSAPFTVSSRLTPLFRWFPILFDLVPYVRKTFRNDDTENKSIRAGRPEYPGHPTRGAASLIFDFLPHLHNDLRNIRAPALLIQARGDRTVPANSLDEFYARIGSSEKEKVWLTRGGHLVLEDYAKEEALARVLEFVQAHVAYAPTERGRRNSGGVQSRLTNRRATQVAATNTPSLPPQAES
jgi:carboxylesterase